MKIPWTQTHLIDCSKSAGTKNLHSFQLRLLQDPQLSLIRGCPAGGQGLHQLTKQTRHIKMLSAAARSENIKCIPLGTTFLIKPQSEAIGLTSSCNCELEVFVTTFVELWHIMVPKKQSAPLYLIRNAHPICARVWTGDRCTKNMHSEHNLTIFWRGQR